MRSILMITSIWSTRKLGLLFGREIGYLFLIFGIGAPLYAVEITGINNEGQMVSLDSQTIEIQTADGAKQFAHSEETVFCRLGSRVYNWEEFVGVEFANIIDTSAGEDGRRRARVVFDAEMTSHLSVSGGLRVKMVFVFPKCVFSREDPLVMRLQSLLNELGYEVTVDGILGPGSQAALVDVAVKNDLLPDGIPSEWLYDRLRDLANSR